MAQRTNRMDSSQNGEAEQVPSEVEKHMTMDLAPVWQEVARFRAQALATTGAIHGDTQEYALVSEFLAKVPISAVFACLQDASDREDEKQVRRFGVGSAVARATAS